MTDFGRCISNQHYYYYYCEVNNIIVKSNNMYFILFTPWSGENTNYVVFQLNAGYSAVTVHCASLTDGRAFCATAKVGVKSCAGDGLMNQGFSCPNGIKTWRWGGQSAKRLLTVMTKRWNVAVAVWEMALHLCGSCPAVISRRGADGINR